MTLRVTNAEYVLAGGIFANSVKWLSATTALFTSIALIAKGLLATVASHYTPALATENANGLSLSLNWDGEQKNSMLMREAAINVPNPSLNPVRQLQLRG